MTAVKIGGPRARSHAAKVLHGASWAGGMFSLTLYATAPGRPPVRLTLDAADADRLLAFLTLHRDRIEAATEAAR